MKHVKSSMGSGLITFVETAKHRSLTSAAKALCVTTGAVSQQLIQLENQLGFTLFHRHSRGIQLSDEGKELLDVVESGLEDIDSVIDKILRSEVDSNEIRLKLTPSFAFKWLVPRLENFHKQYPDIQIQIFAEGALVESEIKDYDLAIDYGPLTHKHADSMLLKPELLMKEKLLPVMSPSYLKGHPQLESTSLQHSDFDSVVLLHDAMPWDNASRDLEWKSWASIYGVEIKVNQGHFFNRTDMAMSAAEAGVGIAMARTALIQDELRTKRLVTPFEPIPAGAGYFLISNTTSPAVEKFTAWLRVQIKNES